MWLLILTLLLVLTAGNATRGDESAPVADDLPYASRLTAPEDLINLIQSGTWQAISEEELQQLQQQGRRSTPQPVRRPGIRVAEYTAVLTGTRLTAGSMKLSLYEDLATGSQQSLPLGKTSLQDLRMRDSSGIAPLAADLERNLYVLRRGLAGDLEGTWTAAGLVAGDTVGFRLELPQATQSSLQIITEETIEVSGTGSLVVGPEPVAEGLKWTILPSVPDRITFSCRRRRQLLAEDPLSLTSLNAGHTLRGDILNSRWTIGVPATGGEPLVLRLDVTPGTRVSGVTFNSRATVDWQLESADSSQDVLVRIPGGGAGGQLEVTGVSVVSDSETWALPILSPQSWERVGETAQGPVLSPHGVINVAFPPTVNVDEWMMFGVVERDVVTGPDQARSFELLRYRNDATVQVRTSRKQAQLTDTVVAVVEQSGRAAAVRCFVNLSCRDASVIEVSWLVRPGWQIVSARYASNQRVLYHELEQRPDASQLLTLHLPETLEPESSRVIEMLVQNTQDSRNSRLQIPLLSAQSSERKGSFVVASAEVGSGIGTARLVGQTTRSITQRELEQQAGWFPRDRLPADKLILLSGGDDMALLPEQSSPARGRIRLRHRLRMDEEFIVEESRLELPAPSAGEQLSLVVPEELLSGISWSVDSSPVSLPQDQVEQLQDNMVRVQIPIPPRAAESDIVVTAVSRLPATSRFTAAVAWPDATLLAEAVLEIGQNDRDIFACTDPLVELPVDGSSAMRRWTLPKRQGRVEFNVASATATEQERSVDLHLYHLLRIRNADIYHRVLAVADVSGRGAADRLSVTVQNGVIPTVLVAGRRVHTSLEENQLIIPLPTEQERLQLVLVWENPVRSLDTLNGRVQLKSPLLNGARHVMTVHHLLISPDLDVRIPTSRFRTHYGSSGMAMQTIFSDVDSRSTGTQRLADAVEVRRFLVEWKLAEAQGWMMQSLVSGSSGREEMELELTEKRRRSAVLAGSILFSLGFCLAVQRLVLGRQRLFAVFVLLLSCGSLLNLPVLIAVAVEGTFWGSGAGLLLLIGLQGILRQIRYFTLRRRFLSATTVFLLSVVPCATADAQQSSRPAQGPPLTASGIISDAGVIYLPVDEINALRDQASRESMLARQALTTGCEVVLRPDAAESLEVILKITATVASSQQGAYLPLPAGDCRLVECEVDGARVFPDPAGDDLLLIPLPASSPLPVKPLSNTPEVVESSADDVAAFTDHEIVCRMRPRIQRQVSGLRLRLPALPCPRFQLQMDGSRELFAAARIQTADTTIAWESLAQPVVLNTLAGSAGIDVSLLHAVAGEVTVETERPQANTLIVCENTTGLQLLTCYYRISRWSSLEGDLQLQIPSGYVLRGVTVVDEESSAEALWRAEDAQVTITMPAEVSEAFFLQLQLQSRLEVSLTSQTIPINELQQIRGVRFSGSSLVASRFDSVFSTSLPERTAAVPAQYSTASEEWGNLIRRSDTLLRVPADAAFELRTESRESRHEVRFAQTCELSELLLSWSCQLDVETSFLPVFRHSIRIPERIRVRSVTVNAGEANRLAGWHVQGNDLIVILREGTLGLHAITVAGDRQLSPNEDVIELSSPTLANSQILESSLSLRDNDGLGLILDDPGDSVSDPSLEPGDSLPVGMELRLQILNEQRPLVLRRANPVDAMGQLISIALPDRIVFVARVSRWSGQQGSFGMKFPEDAGLLAEPLILADQTRIPLAMADGQFVPVGSGAADLSEQTQFFVAWVLPAEGESSGAEDSSRCPWPEFDSSLKWQSWDHLIVSEASAQLTAETPEEQVWGIAAADNLGLLPADRELQEVLTMSRAQLTEPTELVLARRRERSPSESAADKLYAVAMTSMFVQEDDSPGAITDFRIFSRRWPIRCVVSIPENTVILDLPTDENVRWEDSQRRHLLLKIEGPETALRLRWLGTRADVSPFAMKFSFSLPAVRDCEMRHSLSMVSSYKEVPSISGTAVSLTAEEQMQRLEEDLRLGYRLLENSVGADGGQLILRGNEQAAALAGQSQAFLTTQGAERQMRRVRQRPVAFDTIQISYRRRLELSTIIPIGLGLFVVLVATVATAGRLEAEAVTVITGEPLGGETAAAESELHPAWMEEESRSHSGFNRPNARAKTKVIGGRNDLVSGSGTDS